MAYTYRGSGPWGPGKGAALTAAEFDGNTWQHEQDIAAAAAAAGTPVGIANITQSGSQITVILTDATELGPFTLPRPIQRPTETSNVAASTFTPALGDAMKYVRCTNGGGCLVTMPANGDVAFPVDTEIHFVQRGASPIIFEDGGSTDEAVVLNPPTEKLNQTYGRGAVVTFKKVGTNEWDYWGDLAPDEGTS